MSTKTKRTNRKRKAEQVKVDEQNVQAVCDKVKEHYAFDSNEEQDLSRQQKMFVEEAIALAGGKEKADQANIKALSKAVLEKCGDQLHRGDYEEYLQQLLVLLGSASSNANTGTCMDATVERHRPHVHIVTREWEEKFMHEVSGCERPCMNAATGECFVHKLLAYMGTTTPPFAMCEFYVKSVYEDIEARGWVWPTTQHPCIFCVRSMIFSQMMQVRCQKMTIPPSVNFGIIGNIVNVPGEYCAENCFIGRGDSYEGVTVPVVMPLFHHFRIEKRNGLSHVIQDLPYPGDNSNVFFF